MRAFAIAFAAALLVAAPASAASFEALPFQTLPGGTTCLRPTGAPGELVTWAPGGVRFLRAGASGLSAATMVALGDATDCPAAAAQPNGAGVAAAPTAGAISVALREPGGAWGAPVKLAVPEDGAVGQLAAAVSERGDALVAWNETIFQRRGMFSRLRVARRTAGGGFAAPQTLAASSSLYFDPHAQAGIAADGTAIVAWSHFEGSERDPHSVGDLAIAAPGAPFGAGKRLTAALGGGPVLAVAPDGRALVAYGDGGRLRIAERTPGGGFGTAQTIGTGAPDRLAVALGSGDAALVAWGSMFTSGVTYARRADASGFRPPIELTPESLESVGFFRTEAIGGSGGVSTGSGPPVDNAGGDLRAAPASGGRFVLSFGATRTRSGLTWTAAQVETVSPDDSYTTQIVSGPLRDADSVAPVVLDTGAPAVAWTDNGSASGRVHLAAEGAAAVPVTAPRVRIGRPERTALHRADPLVIPVTCSAACDLRASARGLTASASLTRAGTVKLTFRGGHGAAPARPAHVPVTVLSGAPGARDVQTQAIRPRLRRIPDPPLPRVLGLTARRSGSTVTVTWRLNRGASGVDFVAYTSARRDGDPGPAKFVSGSSRTAISVTLRHVPASHKYVNVQWSRGDGRTRRTSVRIR